MKKGVCVFIGAFLSITSIILVLFSLTCFASTPNSIAGNSYCVGIESETCGFYYEGNLTFNDDGTTLIVGSSAEDKMNGMYLFFGDCFILTLTDNANCFMIFCGRLIPDNDKKFIFAKGFYFTYSCFSPALLAEILPVLSNNT